MTKRDILKHSIDGLGDDVLNISVRISLKNELTVLTSTQKIEACD